MKNFIAIIAILLATTTVGFAGVDKAPATKASMSGVIIDKATGEALAGVKVSIEELNQTVYTDLDGNFEFESLTMGTYNIETNMISYEDSKLKVNVEANSNLKIEVNSK